MTDQTRTGYHWDHNPAAHLLPSITMILRSEGRIRTRNHLLNREPHYRCATSECLNCHRPRAEGATLNAIEENSAVYRISKDVTLTLQNDLTALCGAMLFHYSSCGPPGNRTPTFCLQSRHAPVNTRGPYFVRTPPGIRTLIAGVKARKSSH